MATLYTQSSSNRRKTWALLSGFFVFIIILGYLFSQLWGNSLILYVAIGLSIILSFSSYWNSHKMVLAISQAKEVKPEDNRELYRLVENLSISAGLPMPKVYLINDASPNAFATGRNPKNAVVAVTSGLLAKLDRSELEGVIAHELSHIGNYDILLATLISVLVGFVVLAADWFSRSLMFGNRGGNNDNKGGGVIITIIALVLAILAPLFATLMQLAISRKREYMADADGALLTRYPEGLASALEKISADPKPLDNANRATAHLFIASPFKELKDSQKESRPGFFARAFMTHPPTADRIKKLRDLSA